MSEHIFWPVTVLDPTQEGFLESPVGIAAQELTTEALIASGQEVQVASDRANALLSPTAALGEHCILGVLVTDSNNEQALGGIVIANKNPESTELLALGVTKNYRQQWIASDLVNALRKTTSVS